MTQILDVLIAFLLTIVETVFKIRLQLLFENAKVEFTSHTFTFMDIKFPFKYVFAF